MGVVNVTPDSFSDGGDAPGSRAAVAHGLRLAEEGADVLDVGGESTRPGADAGPGRGGDRAASLPVIEGLAARLPGIPLSVDTRKPEVAEAALEAGASIVNDIGAGAEPRMFEVVVARERRDRPHAHAGASPGRCRSTRRTTTWCRRCTGFLRDRSRGGGRRRDRAATGRASTPGSGSGRTSTHNLALLRATRAMRDRLDLPLLVGPSRKRFIGTITGVDDPGDRVEGTAGAVAWCAAQGVHFVRVHDVRAMRRVVQVVDAIARPAERA